MSAVYGFKPDGAHAWMFSQTSDPLPSDFVERQRFKAFSDLAERAHCAGQPRVSEELALGAFKTAVDNVRFLDGTTDLVRFERVRKQATQQKVIDSKPLTLDRAEMTVVKPPKTWVLNDAPGGRPAYVRVERDDLLAAQIVGCCAASAGDRYGGGRPSLLVDRSPASLGVTRPLLIRRSSPTRRHPPATPRP